MKLKKVYYRKPLVKTVEMSSFSTRDTLKVIRFWNGMVFHLLVKLTKKCSESLTVPKAKLKLLLERECGNIVERINTVRRANLCLAHLFKGC